MWPDNKGTQYLHPHTRPQQHIRGEGISSEKLGPLQVPSHLHHRHLLTFVDAITSYAISMPLRSRYELTALTPTIFLACGALTGTLYPASTFYLSMESFRCHHLNISRPAQSQNVFSRSLRNAAPSACPHSRLPDIFWACVVREATFKYHPIPNTSNGTSRKQVWDPDAPKSTTLLPFVVAFWAPIPPTKSNTKLGTRARPTRYQKSVNANHILLLLIESIARAKYRTSHFHSTYSKCHPTLSLLERQ